jgi:hypothetical protein
MPRFANKSGQFLLIVTGLLFLFFLPPSTWRPTISKFTTFLREFAQPALRIKRIQFPKSEQENLEISISKGNSEKLESYKTLHNPIKKYVDATITYEGETYDCEIRLHGSAPEHRTGEQTSYRIKLSKEGKYINGGRTFQLIKLAEGNSPIRAANKLAHDMGLISSYGNLVHVTENDSYSGIFYFTEVIDKRFLEREFGITNYAEIVNTNDWPRKEGYLIHITDLDYYPGHIKEESGTAFRRALFKFQEMTQNSDSIDGYFDTEYMARFFAVAMLFNDVHFITGDNLRLIYNFDDGKFYPVFRLEHWGIPLNEEATFYDAWGTRTVQHLNGLFFKSSSQLYATSLTSKLFQNLLSDTEIRHSRDTLLYRIANNPETINAQLSSCYAESRSVMYHASPNSYYHHGKEENKQFEVVNSILEICRQYLDYTHVYGSYDKSKNRIDLIIDSYVPVTVIDTTRNVIMSRSWRGIELDNQLNDIYNELRLDNLLDTLQRSDLIFINDLTGDTVSAERVHINRISSKGRLKNSSSSDEAFLKQYNIKYQISGDTLVVKSGTYSIQKNNILNRFHTVVLEANVTLNMGEESSLVVYCENLLVRGKSDKPVRIIGKPDSFGNFSVRGVGPNPKVSMDHLLVENGSSSRWNGLATTGQFSVFNANVSISNSSFTASKGDDGLNLKFCKAEINNCTFTNSMADQVDLDFCIAKLTDCIFSPSGIDPNGDGLDLSGSYVHVSNCSFAGFKDKGLSVGERSLALVTQNQFSNNNSGICAKDASNVYVFSNTFENNRSMFTGFVKKKIFGTPMVFADESDLLESDALQVGYSQINSEDFSAQLQEFNQTFDSFLIRPGIAHKKNLDQWILPKLIAP